MEYVQLEKNTTSFVWVGKVIHLANTDDVWSIETQVNCGRVLKNVDFQNDEPMEKGEMKLCPACFANNDFNAINAKMAEIKESNKVISSHNREVTLQNRAITEAARIKAINKFWSALNNAGFSKDKYLGAQIEIDGIKFSFNVNEPQ